MLQYRWDTGTGGVFLKSGDPGIYSGYEQLRKKTTPFPLHRAPVICERVFGTPHYTHIESTYMTWVQWGVLSRL